MSEKLVSPLCLLGLLSTSGEYPALEIGRFLGQRRLPPRSLVRGNKGLSVYYSCSVEKLTRI